MNKLKLVLNYIISLLLSFISFNLIFDVNKNISFSLISIVIISIILNKLILYVDNIELKNKENNNLNYDNVDLFKYIFSIVILILHLHPFLQTSYHLNLFFNNIVGRICVPFFFIVSGYFIAKKEQKKKKYIDKYIKSIFYVYIVWCIIYIPIIIMYGLSYLDVVKEYLNNFNVLIIPFIPLILIFIMFYVGTFYHLWYFPALIISVWILKKWKNKFSINKLLLISFVLLLIGASETYYGLIPISIKHYFNYYFNIFITTRNFLFFGLFYVTLGYKLGLKKEIYVTNSFVKLLICIVLLFLETNFLQTIERLNSNIILSCFPLSYYLFINLIYFNNIINLKNNNLFRSYSKYYYLVHPGIIFIFLTLSNILNININKNIFTSLIQIIIIFICTHLCSKFIIKKNFKFPI